MGQIAIFLRRKNCLFVVRRKKRKLRVSFDLKLNLTRISYVKFDDPSNLMTLLKYCLFYFVYFLFIHGQNLIFRGLDRFIFFLC